MSQQSKIIVLENGNMPIFTYRPSTSASHLLFEMSEFFLPQTVILRLVLGILHQEKNPSEGLFRDHVEETHLFLTGKALEQLQLHQVSMLRIRSA